MVKRNYYDILGIESVADEGQIKAAFHKIAKRDHPDHNPGDAKAEGRFKEANEAYSILSDAEKRAAYDKLGHAAFNGDRARRRPAKT